MKWVAHFELTSEDLEEINSDKPKFVEMVPEGATAEDEVAAFKNIL